MQPYRFVTAASLFDGHDAAINIFRRLLVRKGMEVIHLGHNRSVAEIVKAAVEEDVDAVCISSYQGGHNRFYRYLHDELQEQTGKRIPIFGGGGGTILLEEIQALHEYGIERLYHPDDGKTLGLRGIIKDVVKRVAASKHQPSKQPIARELTEIELGKEISKRGTGRVVGITGPGGAGKSSLIDEMISRLLRANTALTIAVLSFDPTKRKTGGALLGDRIRMNSIQDPRVFVRSMATRSPQAEIGKAASSAVHFLSQQFDLLFVETTGTGQADTAVVDLCDHTLYVMTSEYGASSQLEKIDMLDYADLVVVNKCDHLASEDALADVAHQYARARDISPTPKNIQKQPIFGTIAQRFNDPGVTHMVQHFAAMAKIDLDVSHLPQPLSEECFDVLPPQRAFYLGEVVECIRQYSQETKEVAKRVSSCYCDNKNREALPKEATGLLEQYWSQQEQYSQPTCDAIIRGARAKMALFRESLSCTPIPKIALPSLTEWGEIYDWMRRENFPGNFPYTAGVFAFKHAAEAPKRQFAGEGSPERTNQRFHYLCDGEKSKRLSTAFDSVTLYGEDPNPRPDIYGKVGNSGVSIATLDDMKRLYAGFDLVDPSTSVSLTINGPAPIILAMFFTTAIDTHPDKDPEEVLHKLRGTVQADILKEEQAQNTCIFSAPFALKMMGDMEEYFIAHKIDNFYSVSISGYHIAEAGANPITQLALTLANAFTYVEYYLHRGMKIDDFAKHLSFFFSSGLDPEYSVLGRVARRIWSVALHHLYKASFRSCKLKYHIQTSGRSLHAQEMTFNDIRTTLQALTAFYDNCNSLHTNAYDEAVTTPTEESVRRAMAIQLILEKEFGMNFCDNPMQGSYLLDYLTEHVEEAVLEIFESLSRRGGVLGAMEHQFQRHAIQTESLKYETLKSSGELPIIGVNTWLRKEGEETPSHLKEVIRATEEEKERQVARTKEFIDRAREENAKALQRLRQTALEGGNLFAELMHTVRYASLGQITHTLYRCGGKYRRSM